MLESITLLIGVLLGWVLSHFTAKCQVRIGHRKLQELEEEKLRRELRIKSLNEIVEVNKALSFLLCEIAVNADISSIYWKYHDSVIIEEKHKFWNARREELSEAWFKASLAYLDFQFAFDSRKIVLHKVESTYKPIEGKYKQLNSYYNQLNGLLWKKSDVRQKHVLSEDERVELEEFSKRLKEAADTMLISINSFCNDVQNLALSELFDYQITEEVTGFIKSGGEPGTEAPG